MKDLLKKIGSLLVCVSLVGALAACGGDGDGGKGGSSRAAKDYGQKTAEDAANSYLSAYANLDTDAALEVVLEDSELYSTVEQESMEKQMEAMKEEVPEQVADKAEAMVEDMLDTIAGSSSYKILDVSEEGGLATVEFSMTMLDPSSALGKAQMQAEEKIMEEYSTEELMEMEGDEDKMAEVMLDMMEMMFDIMLDEAETTTIEGTLTLLEVDGEWFVTEEITE